MTNLHPITVLFTSLFDLPTFFPRKQDTNINIYIYILSWCNTQYSIFLQTGAYLAGPDFTMADVYFFPFIGFGVRVGLNLDSFPAMKSYYERLSSRPSIKASWPPHWKESPGSFKPLIGKMWTRWIMLRCLTPFITNRCYRQKKKKIIDI